MLRLRLEAALLAPLAAVGDVAVEDAGVVVHGLLRRRVHLMLLLRRLKLLRQRRRLRLPIPRVRPREW
jgi:hypothetical protein